MSRDYRSLSLWFDQLPGPLTPRPALGAGPHEVDVAIVGAGFTGLWTAYYLLEADPSLRIAVIEAEIAGYGASGRNGGWCSALYPVSPAPTIATSTAVSPIRYGRGSIAGTCSSHSDSCE